MVVMTEESLLQGIKGEVINVYPKKSFFNKIKKYIYDRIITIK